MNATATHVGNCVDVRDVAEAHVKVLTVPQAGGERFIISAGSNLFVFFCVTASLIDLLGPFCWQDVLDAVHAEQDGDKQLFSAVPLGDPGAGKGILHAAIMDTTKAINILDFKFRKITETVKDTAKDLLSRKW